MTGLRRMLPTGRVGASLTAVFFVLVGLVSALAAVLLHADWWGMCLAWAALAAVLVAAPPRWWGRPAFAAGWALVVAWALFPRAEGDFLIAGTAAGWTLVATAPVALVAAMLGGVRGARRTSGKAPAAR